MAVRRQERYRLWHNVIHVTMASEVEAPLIKCKEECGARASSLANLLDCAALALQPGNVAGKAIEQVCCTQCAGSNVQYDAVDGRTWRDRPHYSTSLVQPKHQ